MKKIINKSKKAIIVTGIGVGALMATVTANAQGNPAGPGTSGSGVKANGQPPASGGAPIDGGASILIVATAAYTGKKLAKMKEAKKKIEAE